MISKRQAGLSSGLILAVALQSGCGSKKDSSDDSSSDQPTSTAGTNTGSNTSTTTDTTAAMLQVYPSQLALSIFSSDDAAALRLLADTPTEEDEQAAIADASRTPAKVAAESKERLQGKASSCIPDILKRPPPMGRGETCYEFDQDQIYGKRGSGGYSGNKNGLNANGEACMVAFAKSKVAVVNDLLERAKAMVETMLCQAKKSNPNLTPPAASGESLDLKAALAEGMSGRADEFEVAKLERIDVDGVAVYKSTIVSNRGGGKRTIVLVHAPDAEETYHGTLYTIQHAETGLTLSDHSGLGLNALPNNSAFDRVLSIKYARIEDPAAPGSYRMQGELLRANLDPALTDTALGSTGILDLSAIRKFDVPEADPDYGKPVKNGQVVAIANQVLTGQTKISFDLSDDGVGTTSYFENPGGNYSEAARGMVANVVKTSDGMLKGCSVSGAALGKDNLMQSYSIAKAQKLSVTLNPVGFWHPFFHTPQQNKPGCNAPTTGSDTDGNFHEIVCTAGSPDNAKWYQPAIADTAMATEFVTNQVGNIITRQCYKLNNEGIWAIDTDEIAETAGYELVRNTATNKLIAPPQLNEKVRPFGGEVGKKVQ